MEETEIKKEMDRITKLFEHGYITAEQWERQIKFYLEKLNK